MSQTTNDWREYYAATNALPPRPLLIKALEHVRHKHKALDIGSGALNDTRHLLEQGFEVTAIDASPSLAEIAGKIKSSQLRYFVTTFADFEFPKNDFDLANAMFSLPFNPPDTFDAVFAKIKQSLVSGGVLCCNLFGTHDEWHANPAMTFHTKKQAEKLLADMEVIALVEKEYDGTLANGGPKHWHVYFVIAKRP